MAKQPGITFSALKSFLDKGRIAPVYLITGPDASLAHEAVRMIADAAARRDGGVSRTAFDGDETDLATVLDEVRTLDLFSPARLVVVSPADNFIEKYGDPLADYAGKPIPKGFLVLVVEKADARRKLTKTLEKGGGLVTCKPLYERELLAWIAARARAMGLQIDSAAGLLAEFLGADLAAISSELEKLAAYLGDRKKITPEDIEAVSLPHRGRKIYELTDAIGKKEPAKVLGILDTLFQQGQKAPSILFFVSKHIRKLWAVKEMTGKGENPALAARRVGVNYFIEQFLAQVNSFTWRELRRSSSALVRCEATLKSSSIDERLLLETTFLRLAGAGSVRKKPPGVSVQPARD